MQTPAMLTVNRVKLDQVCCAFSSCNIVEVHDLEIVGAIKGQTEGQTADPATPVV